MKRLVVCVALLTLSSAAVAETGLDNLAWMSGEWEREREGIRMEEYWSAPAGGVMVGVHRDVLPGRRAFFEYLRIEQRDDEIVYVAMPSNQRPAEFRLSAADARRAVFENPDHDFPQKIIYEREGDTLTATVEGVVNGETKRSGWEWDLVKRK